MTRQSWVQFAAQAHVLWEVQAIDALQQVRVASAHISDLIVADKLILLYS